MLLTVSAAWSSASPSSLARARLRTRPSRKFFIDAPALAHFLRTLPDHDDQRKVAYANAEALYRLESSLSVSNDETARLPGAVMSVGSEKRDRIL